MIRLAAFLASVPALGHAADNAAPVLDLAAVLQMIASLALVLGVIVALAWLLRRIGSGPVGNAGLLRVISSTAIGQKERVVVVEISDLWLVLGVAPGQVSALYTLPRQEGTPAPAGPTPASFAQWMQRALGKQGRPDA
jgi:flagellar protein FliO/FliZ